MVNPCEITTYKQGSESDYYRYMDGWMDGWIPFVMVVYNIFNHIHVLIESIR